MVKVPALRNGIDKAVPGTGRGFPIGCAFDRWAPLKNRAKSCWPIEMQGKGSYVPQRLPHVTEAVGGANIGQGCVYRMPVDPIDTILALDGQGAGGDHAASLTQAWSAETPLLRNCTVNRAGSKASAGRVGLVKRGGVREPGQNECKRPTFSRASNEMIACGVCCPTGYFG